MAKARISHDIIEVWGEQFAYSPTTVTGAGVSQDVIEVWLEAETHARIANDVIEVWLADDETQSEPGGGGGGPGSGGGIRTFGYAG